ncbi:hypothetical protein PG997_000579 [Apiospora hydei]|uniref:Phospholipase/carboxylesterase/thioesterase domain-containing protein n=1 Tax=Apiospora hydei TaxID=1337664 RepID=A0ABR1XB57_9PEZI
MPASSSRLLPGVGPPSTSGNSRTSAPGGRDRAGAGGAKNVVFGGLSQGCAASLVALLLWDGDPLGAFVGMAGWFPYAYRLSNLIQLGTEEDDPFDPFQRDDKDETSPPKRPIDEAVAWLREQIELSCGDSIERVGSASGMTPVFLGHGVLDDKVSVVLGRMARDTLTQLGLQVMWKEYGDLGHWYSNDMLRDLAEFLRCNSLGDTQE